MRVLVTGGRDFSDRELVFAVLDRINADTPIATVIHGAATGADTLAGNWAEHRRIAVIACPADWKQHGRAAGPIRNKEMLENHSPDLVVAFPGGRGTENMVRLAEQAGTKVVTVTEKSH